MKYTFYALCALPMLCFLVTCYIPNGLNHGPSFDQALILCALWAAILLFSPLLTLFGVLTTTSTLGGDRLAAGAATVVAALPGLYLITLLLAAKF